MYICTTPVVFIFFNRPNEMRKVLSVVEKVKPKKMYFLSDGPRNENERVITDVCRQIIDDCVTWPCEKVKIYSEENMGCCNRIYSGLTEVFSREDKAIILEDDILPSISFFKFQECMLNRYKNDDTVFSISAYNRFAQDNIYGGDYCLVNHFECWGWGTWSNRWNKVDFEMNKLRDYGLEFWKMNLFKHIDKKLGFLRFYLYRKTLCGIMDSWAYRVSFHVGENGMSSVMPRISLTKNIGFDENATHTRFMATQDMDVEIQEFEDEIYNDNIGKSDNWMNLQILFETENFWTRITKMIIKDIINAPFRAVGAELRFTEKTIVKLSKYTAHKLKVVNHE